MAKVPKSSTSVLSQPSSSAHTCGHKNAIWIAVKKEVKSKSGSTFAQVDLWEMCQCTLKLFNGYAKAPFSFPDGSVEKTLPANGKDEGAIPGAVRSAGDGKGSPPQYSLPGKPHGWRSLENYSPWGCKESDMTKQLNKRHLLRVA